MVLNLLLLPLQVWHPKPRPDPAGGRGHAVGGEADGQQPGLPGRRGAEAVPLHLLQHRQEVPARRAASHGLRRNPR